MLHLASKSPRRRELLARLGVAFTALDVDVPEQRAPGEPAHAYVCRVAAEKAAAGLASLRGPPPGALVLGADTEVVLDDDVFGKPADDAAAREMLLRLSGRTHEVVSAVTLLGPDGVPRQAVSVSRVAFAPLLPDQVAAYVASGEPRGKAGGYAIQGVAEAFVTRLEGSYSGVMGLPLHQTAMLLAGAGVEIPFTRAGKPT